MVNNKSDKELRDMLTANLASRVSSYEVKRMWDCILSFAKNRTEKKRAKDSLSKLLEKYSVSNPLIEELNEKIRSGKI